MEDGPRCFKRVRYGDKDFKQTLLEWDDNCSSSSSSSSEVEDHDDYVLSEHDSDSEIELENENWENSENREAGDDTIETEDEQGRIVEHTLPNETKYYFG
nr:unnamed protein product [Callosobruchus analis]